MKTFDNSIDELLGMIKDEKISVEELTLSYLEQIEKKDNDLESYITIDNEGALNKAKTIDKKKADGEKLGALAGIPMVVSDDISTKGIKTSLNSKMMENYIPSFDATIIEKIYKEDAVLLGKSSIAEFGVGKVVNPWGTATAVANDGALIGIASDTSGEVRQSAVAHGLCGFKPTYGLVSRYGLIGSASSFEQIGVIAKNIKDLPKVFDVIKGKDKKDSTTLERDVEPFVKDLDGSLKNIKIALPKEYFKEELIPESIKTMERLGATIEYVSIPSLKYTLQVYEVLSSGEFTSNMGKYDGIAFGYRASDYNDVDELYKKSRAQSFGYDVKKKIIFGNYILSSGQYKDFYVKAQRVRGLIIKEVNDVFNKYDLIITPVINEGKDLDKNFFTVTANIVGLPALAMPSIDGNNVGLQLMGPAFSEEMLFAIGSIYSNEKRNGGEK